MTKIITIDKAPAGSIVEMIHSRGGSYVSSGDFYRIDGKIRQWDGGIRVWKRFRQGDTYIYPGNLCMVVDWNSLQLEGF